jgi:hypothetical protein
VTCEKCFWFDLEFGVKLELEDYGLCCGGVIWNMHELRHKDETCHHFKEKIDEL